MHRLPHSPTLSGIGQRTGGKKKKIELVGWDKSYLIRNVREK